MIVDMAIHDPDKGEGIPNPHVHVMCPIRPMNEDGTWGEKQKREYLFDLDGNPIFDDYGKQKFNAVPTTDWNRPEVLEQWRKAWANLVNSEFEKHGMESRIDHRSYAIDFVANYYGVNLKEAAERIASEFVLSYDNIRYSNGFTKQKIPKKSEYQIWMEQKRELFAQLSKLHEKLRQMKIEYAPKDREDSTWSPLFALTEKEFNYVDYLYDYCMFEAADGELKEKYEELRKELKRIEKRVYDTESGDSGSDVGQGGERMAV